MRIPALRNWFAIIFLMAWLGGWIFGEVSAINSLLDPQAESEPGFLIVWLIGWTIGGGVAILWVFWQIAGMEIIEICNGVLRRRLHIAGLGYTRCQDLE